MENHILKIISATADSGPINAAPTVTPPPPSVTPSSSRNLHTFNSSFVGIQERILRLRSSAMMHVRQWEDLETQKKVRDTIPVTLLFKRASELLEQNESTDGFDRGELLKHSLLITLTDWFKNEFFKWTDGNIIRYNNSEKLLETREGKLSHFSSLIFNPCG
jgi:hypothetical protein